MGQQTPEPTDEELDALLDEVLREFFPTGFAGHHTDAALANDCDLIVRDDEVS